MNEAAQSTNDGVEPQRLASLIAALNRSAADGGQMDEAVLRDICRLGAAGGRDAESFRRLLAGMKLGPPLAGSIKGILKSNTARDGFLRPDAPISWAESVELAWKEIDAEVDRLLSRREPDESAENGGCFRQLCRWAVEWGLDPETFRQRLIRAKFIQSRASNFKRILDCPDVCDRFIAPNSTLSWDKALEEAIETAAQKQRTPDYQLKRGTRKLIRRAVKYQQQAGPATVPGGEWSINCEAAGKITFHHEKIGKFTLELLAAAPASPVETTPSNP